MLWIKRKRRCGKTTALIHMSAVTGAPIITNTLRQVSFIESEANKLKMPIPKPISIYEWKQCNRGIRFEKGILIDDLDIMLPYILNNYFGTKILSASVTMDDD